MNGECVVATRQPQFAANELQAPVANQSAGQQPRLHQHLKAIADAEHRPPLGRKALHRLHDRRELGDRPAAEVIAVSEAARQDYRIHRAQAGGVVPDEFRLLAEVLGDRVKCIVVAIASGKDNDAESHDVRGEATPL